MILDSFQTRSVSPEEFDTYLENGYRHFGTHFFRYSYGELEDKIVKVLPLRVGLKHFSHSKSQRKVLKKNRDAKVIISKPHITEEMESLFEIHKQKFSFGIPPSLHTFLGTNLGYYPCEMKQVSAYDGDRLYSVSFLDLGMESSSSVYGFYDPEYSVRSPGLFTMLLEIEYSLEKKLSYYYSGYCYKESSYYDYKKNFSGLEYYDWEESWIPYEK